MRRIGLVTVVVLAMVLGGSALPTAASAAATGKATYAWGHNTCGMGEWDWAYNYAQTTPVPMAGLVHDVTQVSAGGAFNIVLRADGTVWAWGLNDWGQVGDGTSGGGAFQASCVPQRVLGLPPGIVHVSAGVFHSLAVASDGSVWAWGTNHFGELGIAGGGTSSPVAVRVPVMTGVRQVAAGLHFSVALRNNGEVWTWGRGDRGQLGDGTHILSRPTPARAPMGYGVIQISAGFEHALALRPGSLWAWGANDAGQLGNGTTVTDSATAVRVDRRTDRVTQIDAGGWHNLALDADGSIWAWGSNWEGQLGIGVVDAWTAPGRNIPLRVVTTPGATQISAGTRTSLAVLADGGSLMWGSDYYGTLGDGTRNVEPNPVPTRVPGMTGVLHASVDTGTVAIADGVIVPDVIGDIEVTAVWRLQNAGLVVHIERPYNERDCERVGYVAGQGPSAGRVVRPGSTVVIEVPKAPPTGCF